MSIERRRSSGLLARGRAAALLVWLVAAIDPILPTRATAVPESRVGSAVKICNLPIVSEQICDVGRGITLCYETFGDAGDPPRCW